jgi:2'-5' RNA ligase
MRLFTAIDLPAEMLDNLSEFLARLRPLAKLHWSPVENLHITTKFIGEWPEPRIDEMKTALRNVAATGPIDISVRGLGWFPDSRHPHIFWTGVNAGKALSDLARSTEQAAAALGVPVEKRAYSPHLTLARIKNAVRLDDLRHAMGDPDFGSFQASSFFLYLSSNGKYSKLAEFLINS